VRRECRSLSRRVPPNVDPVRNRRPRRAVRAHLFEAVAGQQAKEEEQPGDPGDQFTWHRRLHDPHSRESGRPRTDLVHPHVVTMAVAALRVIAQQQVRVLARQQCGQPFRRFADVRPREPGPARRVIEQDRSVPAVRVAEVHGPVSA
jgi:hypothetical protein